MVVEKHELQADHSLDARGLSCPLPLLKAKQALNNMTTGQVLHVIATDAGSRRDFQRFAELSSHVMLNSETLDGDFHYWLRKGTTG